MSYYGGYYDDVASAKASGNPRSTWIFKTDEKGEIHYNSSYQVQGDALYTLSDGKTPALPLGTIVYQEVKAPAGYNLNSQEFSLKLTCYDTNGNRIYSENCCNYANMDLPDTVQRGDYHLFKEAPIDYEEEEQLVPIPDIMFEITNENEGKVVSPDSNLEVDRGGVVTTITTNYNSIADTKDHRPANWTCSLAYGTYKVHEIIPENVRAEFKEKYGLTLLEVPDWYINITHEGQYDPITVVKNRIPQTPIVVNKLDTETKQGISDPCCFEIYKKNGEVYGLVTYKDRMLEQEISSWTTINGRLCLPMKLEEGEYKLVETKAPEGYTLNKEGVSFSVNEYHLWDDPINIYLEDTPIHVQIDGDKIDTNAAVVPNAKYELCADGDIITGDGTLRYKNSEHIASVTTDEEGHFSILEHDALCTAEYLPLYLGSYTLYETKSPDTWALDTSEHHICVVSQGQDVPLVIYKEKLIDEPTTLIVDKVDSSDNSKKLQGAKFYLWNESGTIDMPELVTDENGQIKIEYLEHGTYYLEETESPEGYTIPEELGIINFTVDDQGLIQYGDSKKVAVFTEKVENDPILSPSDEPASPAKTSTPRTGDPRAFIAIALSLLIVSAATFAYLKWAEYRRRKKIEKLLEL